MKIALGTANFNNKYGILKNNISQAQSLKNIFKIIKKQQINYLDTAFDYSSISKLNKNCKLDSIKIITKIKLPKKNKILYIDNLEKIVKAELIKLKISSFEAILIHSIGDLKSVHADIFVKKIKLLKKLNYVKKIGASIYDPKDLKIVFSKFTPEIIQAPINIFDNRILSSKWFGILKKKKIIIQARSIFLQGLLTKKISILKKIITNRSFLLKIKKLDSWCNLNKISRLEACLNFIKSINEVNILTFGINSPDELIEILDILKKKKNIAFIDFSTKKLEIIDPRKWKNK